MKNAVADEQSRRSHEAQAEAHDVRERITSTAQNVKERVEDKLNRHRDETKTENLQRWQHAGRTTRARWIPASPFSLSESLIVLLAPVQNVRRDKDEEHDGDNAVKREERRVEPAEIAGRDDGVLIGEKTRRRPRTPRRATGPKPNACSITKSSTAIPACMTRAIQNAPRRPNACGTLYRPTRRSCSKSWQA